MTFLSRKGFLLFILILVDLFLQFYTKSVGWGSRNNGFSFGLGEGKVPVHVYLLLVGILIFFVVWKKMIEFGWWLVIAGGITNAIARLATGSVWDYLHWPVLFSLWFNLADVSITLGVALCFYELMKKDAKA